MPEEIRYFAFGTTAVAQGTYSCCVGTSVSLINREKQVSEYTAQPKKKE